MNFNEMSTQQLLLCINASASNHYIPTGMESLITTHIIPLNQNIDKHVHSSIKELLLETTNDLLGYLLENIQTKEIHQYFDLIFNLENRYQFDPLLVAHFSYDELVDYLQDFLKASVVDDIDRSVEIFDDRQPKSWKTLTKLADLESVDTSIKIPAIIERPFFSDIHFNITKQGRATLIKSTFGQLKSVQPYFSKTKAPTGELFSAKNKVFLKWRDIHQFKLGSTQSKSFLGVSVKGEFVAATKLISHDIGLKMISIEDIDSFKLRINKKVVDVSPKEITQIEINLDTQQMIMTRDVTEDDFHISRFKRLKLKKGDQVGQINKIVSFNRGSSNFEQIQTIFGTRYTECEKARNILNARGEYGLLGTRNIAAGDLASHLVLTSMKLLGFLPFNIQCIGFKPEDVNNPKVSQSEAISWIKDVQNSLSEIMDVSKTPSFTEHNFSRLTKTVRTIIKRDNLSDITPQHLEQIIEELEGLILYMDDFFKLNIYQKLEDDLECETVPDLDEESQQNTDVQAENEDLRLDDQAKNFITENYTFFEKRDHIESVLIKIEKILFYNKNIKPFAEDLKYDPDLILYTNSNSQLQNYRLSSYPSVSTSKVLDTKTLEFKNEGEELRFIRFMRAFTQKCHQKALELNKTFHHQFKHTLSELTFIADEKLMQLKDELAFLEIPDNKEAAYQTLFEKITALYHQHLKDKQENIDNLEKEYTEIKARYEQFKSDLERLLDTQYTEEELGAVLSQMPEQLETMKQEILSQHKTRLAETSPVFNAYLKLYNASINYFKKILKYSNLFLKALWVHRNKAAFQEVKLQTVTFFSMDTDVILLKVKEFENFQHDENKEKRIQQEIHNLSQKIKSSLIEMSKIPVKGLFQDKNRDMGDLTTYLTYYKRETDSLCSLIKQLHPTYQRLSQLQNLLFKKQEELVSSKLEKAKNDLRIQISKMICNNPECHAEIDDLERKSEKVPKEIKDELGDLRGKLVESVNHFKTITAPVNLEKILDYETLFAQADNRHQINEISKELVNFTQGLTAIGQEKEGEIEDLNYLSSQEENLEQVAMSKALPSTRILLKNNYIPMIEREKKMLLRANQFLSEIISNEKAINQVLVSTFFHKRFGVYQFINGTYCLDITAGAKDHTEKNIYNAFMLIAERLVKACSGVVLPGTQVSLKKVEVKGIPDLRNLISQIWQGHVDDRFILLPSSLSLEEAFELCEYKDLICQKNPKSQKSKNSLILIYVHKIAFEAIERSPELKIKYNQAILSNIFINVDGVEIFNNRDSIYDACIRETFGKCHDKQADQIMHNFLFAS
ncbi:MAG: hypothetical protein HN580_30355 [Deltaproteobacteria bacterium]|nr:hypothetical protein [Deltaproteobacteria bacterium]MBT4268118.1 hypothetical protein [Deltaproteobacteria bacterium]MBT4640253.1 hypothetical protein [Deltaproteobacteria bacterium]MBT6614430.1 hypothetical protein [Deltaproteobacteria bacterium]MBT7151884.1 hypothetical protein [Deltaproteobacteria bacterium]